LPWNGVGEGLYEWEEVEGPAPNDETDSITLLRLELVGTEPYRLGDARRKHEAEAQQNGVLQ
jgi:hypothetical protein